MQNCLENMFLLYCHSVMTQTTFISFNNKDSFSSRQDLKLLWKCQSSSNSGVLLKLGRCSPGIFQIAGGNYKTPFKLGPSETILQIILNKNKQQNQQMQQNLSIREDDRLCIQGRDIQLEVSGICPQFPAPTTSQHYYSGIWENHNQPLLSQTRISKIFFAVMIL